MNRSEAKAVCALLSAGFPKDPMPPSTVEVWSSKLAAFDFTDAEEAARDVVDAFDRMPSLKTFEDAIRETRAVRLRNTRPVLPTGDEPYYPFVTFLAEHDEPRERISRIRRKDDNPSNPIIPALVALIEGKSI